MFERNLRARGFVDRNRGSFWTTGSVVREVCVRLRGLWSYDNGNRQFLRTRNRILVAPTVPWTRPLLTGSRNTCAPTVPTHLPLADLSRSVSQTNVRLDIPLKNTDRNFQLPPLQFLTRDMQFPRRASVKDASCCSRFHVMYEIFLWYTLFYGIFQVFRRQYTSSLTSY